MIHSKHNTAINEELRGRHCPGRCTGRLVSDGTTGVCLALYAELTTGYKNKAQMFLTFDIYIS